MKLSHITKKYKNKVVFNDFNIEFLPNEVTCILGASGCGKTTLLNIIAGLTDYDGKIDGKSDRCSYIFQEPRLLPNLTVYQNLDLVQQKEKLNKNVRKEKISAMLSQLDLTDVGDKHPKELSGGMSQRVSLGRAFLYEADTLLMDEPFKGLDITLKKKIINVFRDLYRNCRLTTIFVTHDLEEALTLADRIIVMGINGEIMIDYRVTPDMFERDVAQLGDIRNKIYDKL